MKIVSIILVLLAITACQADQKFDTKAINQKILAGDFDMYEQLDICRCDSLQTDSLEIYYKNDLLYTGVCFRTFPNSDKKSEVRQIFKGQLHGNRIELSENGDTLVKSIYNLGELVNRITKEPIICPCDSLNEIINEDQETIMYYQNLPFNGICQRYFPAPDTNKIYLEIPYKNGLINGNMIFYNRQGNEILTEPYENGERLPIPQSPK